MTAPSNELQQFAVLIMLAQSPCLIFLSTLKLKRTILESDYQNWKCLGNVTVGNSCEVAKAPLLF